MKSFIRILFSFLILITLSACQSVNDDALVESDDIVSSEIDIVPISHATAVLKWDGSVIYSDPTGGIEAFEGQTSPDLVLLTDIHGDHLNPETLEAVLTENSTLVVPQAVADQLSENLKGDLVILSNGETTQQKGFSIKAIPMYNLPESEDAKHTKGRGNGYVIERGGMRVYFSGDTADIPEMRALQGIDIAFVSMNLPYTMSVEDAADAVIDFKPVKIYPYHYRGQDGLSDVGKFKQIVDDAGLNIDVVQLNWYPE